MLTQSKCASGNGSFSASHCTTGRRRPALIRRSRPAPSIVPLMSVSTTVPAGADAAREIDREIAGAAGKVEDAHARAHARRIDGEALPQPVQARRHEIVHQVVLAGDRVEHVAHALRLVFDRDLLEAEIRPIRHCRWLAAGREQGRYIRVPGLASGTISRLPMPEKTLRPLASLPCSLISRRRSLSESALRSASS